MREVLIDCLVQGFERQKVYDTLKDTEVYRRNAQERVKHVDTTPSSDGKGAVTNWEVYFRNGLLAWSERDCYLDEEYTIEFEQIDGDFDQFWGSWTVGDDAEGDVIKLRFNAHFEFGVPSLESIVSPVAARVLTQTMSDIVLAVFPGSVILGSNAIRAVGETPIGRVNDNSTDGGQLDD